MSPEGKVEVALGYLKREHLSKFQRFEQSYFSKSKVWMWTGLSIILFGLVLMTIRDLNELNFLNLLLLGVVPNSLSGLFGSPTVESFRQTITTETIIQHSIEQILLLGMSLFKLAIGGFIFLIVQNLVATRKYVITKAQAGGVPIEEGPKTHLFAKIFPLLLILGTDIQFFNVGVLMSIWDLNALNILGMQFAGTAIGADFQSAVFVEQLIGSLVVPVEMAGAAMMLAGIPLGLATIVVNLRMQGKMFPTLLSYIISRRISTQPMMEMGTKVARTPKIDPFNNAEGIAPQKTVIFTMLGFLFGISGLVVFFPIRAANVVAIVNESFFPMASTALNGLKLFDSIMAITVEQFLFVGLGVVVFAINIFLLQIIKALRAQRKFFEETLESTIGTQLTPLENPLWTTRAALIFALIGFGLMILNFLFSVVAAEARIAGDPLTDGTFTILVRNVKLSAFGFLLIGVGLSLVTIMINLQLTARTLPNFFSRLLQFVQTGRRDAGKIELPEPMSLAPWKLFYVILAGAIITILVTFPSSLIEVQSFLNWNTLLLAGNTTSATYASSLLIDRLLEHSLLPVKLFGMGLMLFGVGRTFGVIIGFVKARRQIISEGVDSLLTLTNRKVEEGKPVENLGVY